MVQDNGVGAFYKGHAATASARRAVERALLHVLRAGQVDLQEGDGRRADTDQNLALGALSGMTAAIMTPIDVVKTRLMTVRRRASPASCRRSCARRAPRR